MSILIEHYFLQMLLRLDLARYDRETGRMPSLSSFSMKMRSQ